MILLCTSYTRMGARILRKQYLYPQRPPNRLADAPDDAIARTHYLRILQGSVDALVGHFVSQGFVTFGQLLAPVDVEEFHFRNQIPSALANGVKQLCGCYLIAHYKRQVLHDRRIIADGRDRLHLPTWTDEGLDVHLRRVNLHPGGQFEIEQHLRVNLAHDAQRAALQLNTGTWRDIGRVALTDELNILV